MDRRSLLGGLLASLASSQERPSNLTELTLAEASDLVHRRQVSPVELTKACLSRIDQLNPGLNAYVHVLHDDALATAKEREQEIKRGYWRGPLHGIPIGLKDLIDVAGVPTTGALSLLAYQPADTDAVIVQKLRLAGAVILGKQNLHQIALGTSAAISYFHPVHNPWDRSRISGGSSGGSAAAVAAGFDFGSVGTDTAGSIRIPSALCGVVGLKPTYRLVDSTGVLPLSKSFDHVGPICRTVLDTALMLDALSAGSGTGGFASHVRQGLANLRLGRPALLFAGVDSEVRSCVETAIQQVIRLTDSTIRDVSIPYWDAITEFIPILRYEAYNVHKRYLRQDDHAYHKWIRRTLYKGAAVSQSTYEAALKKLETSRRDIQSLFKDVDLLLLPTVAVPAMTIQHARCLDPDIALSRDTQPFNVLGLPAITVPCGFTRRGLPVGLQIVGPPRRDIAVLQLASAYEQSTPWRKRNPVLH